MPSPLPEIVSHPSLGSVLRCNTLSLRPVRTPLGLLVWIEQDNTWRTVGELFPILSDPLLNLFPLPACLTPQEVLSAREVLFQDIHPEDQKVLWRAAMGHPASVLVSYAGGQEQLEQLFIDWRERFGIEALSVRALAEELARVEAQYNAQREAAHVERERGKAQGMTIEDPSDYPDPAQPQTQAPEAGNTTVSVQNSEATAPLQDEALQELFAYEPTPLAPARPVLPPPAARYNSKEEAAITHNRWNIKRLPPSVVDAMQARRVVREPSERQSWPFKVMEVGDAVTVPENVATKAQTAAHVYAQRTGKVFLTRRNRLDKTMTIARLE